MNVAVREDLIMFTFKGSEKKQNTTKENMNENELAGKLSENSVAGAKCRRGKG